MKRKLLVLIFCIISLQAFAQRVSLSTNLADWSFLGTANLEVGVAVSQHFSLNAGVKYNPWEFTSKKTDVDVWNKMKTADAGIRYWPWYVNSGWWIGMKGRWQKVARTGIWRPALEESTALGGGLSAGYTLILTKHLNLDFGWGAWCGKYLDYVLYECPKCMEVRENGSRFFVRPDNIVLTVSVVF